MLQSIRDKTKGWIAYVIIGLLAVPFMFFGAYDYFTGGSNPVVAEVNGIEITRAELDQAQRRQQAQLRQMLGENFDPAMFDEGTMRRQALEQLVTRAVITDFVQRQGFRVTDEALLASIRAQPYFQVDGRFSSERYRTVLQQNNLAPEQFEAQMRQDAMITQLQEAVAESAVITDREVDRFVALSRQQRDLAWLHLRADALAETVEVTDEDVRAYYEENREAFRRPEQVRIEYLELSRETMQERVEVDEATLRSRYEELKDSRFTDPGTRRVRHILIEVPEDADQGADEAARERIASLRRQIAGGEADFAELAREYSDDPGSRNEGGGLGRIERGDMVEPFEEAAFALEEGELSQPVRTEFGWHLIQATAVSQPSVRPFEEVRDEVRRLVAGERVQNRFFELGNELANLAYENPNSLEPAARALDLQVQRTDWVSREGAEDGVAARPEVVEAAFGEEVLERGLNSEVIELDEGRRLVLRVAERRPAEIRALEAVRDQVRQRLRDERAATLAEERGEELLKRARSGEALPQLAQEGAVELVEPGWIGRDAGDVPATVSGQAFRLPRPQDDTPSLSGVALPGGGYAVVTVRGVRDGDPAELAESEREEIRRQLQQQEGSSSIEQLITALRAEADVEVHEGRL